MNNEPQTIGEQIRSIAEDFLRRMAPVIQQAQRVEDEMIAEKTAWEGERRAWAKERTLLRDSAIIAERRESTVQKDLSEANDEIARLLAQLNIIADATERGTVGAKIQRRLQDGLPGFETAVEPSNRPVATKGEPYLSISADIEESVRVLATMEDKKGPTTLPPAFIKAMEDDMQELAKVAKG